MNAGMAGVGVLRRLVANGFFKVIGNSDNSLNIKD